LEQIQTITHAYDPNSLPQNQIDNLVTRYGHVLTDMGPISSLSLSDVMGRITHLMGTDPEGGHKEFLDNLISDIKKTTTLSSLYSYYHKHTML
jgi:hypothetical protein